MQGRLLGKRVDAGFFLESSPGHGLEGCNYLLALDMEMDPQAGYAMASWEQGYGDFVLTPDLSTLRKTPGLAGGAPGPGGAGWGAGPPVVASPRHVLQAKIGPARALGLEPMMGSEL